MPSNTASRDYSKAAPSVSLRAAMATGVAIDIENEYDADDLEEQRATANPVRTGIGLAHVKRRLAVRYGDDASFDAHAEKATYRVSLRLPCESAAVRNGAPSVPLVREREISVTPENV